MNSSPSHAPEAELLGRELREFAQVPDRYTLIPADVDRFVDERVCIIQGNTWAGVCGVRVREDEVEDLLAESRARIAAGKTIAWWLDPDTQPGDLRERLIALGLEVPDSGSLLHALACVEEPPAGPADVSVRPVETLEEWRAAVELQWEAFDTPEEERQSQQAHLEDELEAALAAGVPVTFVAELAGRVAGVGRSVYSDRGVFLIAGSVAEWARGRGVYRALVRARWDDALARGTPALVTEALPDTSYPILKRCGFVDVCTTARLRDNR
jgi:hypothetical protein